MDSKEYWSKRFEQLEDATNTSSVAKYYDIEKLIDKSQRQIESKINSWYGRYARNNGITIEQARKELNYSELEELRWSVEEYIEKGRENAIDGRWMRQLENASSKFHINRLEAIKMQIQAESELLFGDITDEIDTHIKSQYIDRYYRSAFEIQRGTGIGSSMSAIDEKALEKIVTRPWSVDGKNFVTRVGESKVQLINNVNNALTQMCLTGNNPDKAISLLASTMRGNKARAKRIILTESAFFASESQKESFKELGVKEYEVVATLDTKTSEICQEMDGKHYPMKDFQSGITAPPFHPNCRSTTCPYFNDEFTQDLKRTARDKNNDNIKVPQNMTYKEWKNKFISNDTDILKNHSEGNTIKKKSKARKQIDTGFEGKIPDSKLEEFNDKALRQIIEDTGYSKKDAKVLQDTLIEYFGGNHSKILNDIDGKAKIISQGISKMPPFKGSISRGISLDGNEIEKFKLLKVGDKLPQYNTLSSWSSNDTTAIAYSAISEYESDSVIIRCKDNKSAVGMQHVSMYGKDEAEVLSNSSYEVVDIITQSKYEYLNKHKEYLWDENDLVENESILRRSEVCEIVVKEKN